MHFEHPARIPSPDDLLTVDDLALLLKVSRASAYKCAQQMPRINLSGAGRAGRPGGRIRIRRADYEAWLAKGRLEPTVATDDEVLGAMPDSSTKPNTKKKTKGTRAARQRATTEVDAQAAELAAWFRT